MPHPKDHPAPRRPKRSTTRRVTRPIGHGLVGELSTCSELFRQRWASQDVRLHRSGRKRVRHPIVGQLDLDVESLALPAEPGLHLNVCTVPAGTPTADNLALLASWAATQQTLATEIEAHNG
ncbi:hypothetical protein [Streptomyces sp. SAI-126]|uniref:MmyB family transcriptional regulator n=1 Tax=Streptomyces sp. SAI-126 TaxID=3377732 RepID=UPI003C7984C0